MNIHIKKMEGVAADENKILVGWTGYLGSSIRMSLDFLCKNSTNLGEVIIHLINNDLLSQRESKDIQNQLSDYDSFFKLFTFIIPRLRYGKNSQHFFDAFTRSGNEHIIQRLNNVVVTTDFAPRVADDSSLRRKLAEMGGRAATDENTLVDTMSDLGNRIRVSLALLCENSTNLPMVLVHLLSNNVISQHESEVVKNQLSGFKSFYQLFNFIIPKLGHGGNSQHFLDALQWSGNEHIVEALKSAVVTTVAPTSTDTSCFCFQFKVREPVPSFVGREKFLRELHQQIVHSHTKGAISTISTMFSHVCVVTGLGGIGKTETIRMYIHIYGHCYQHIVWIDAGDPTTAENQFRRLALELQLSSNYVDNKAKDFQFLLNEIYDRLCTKQTLLVFDNADVLHDSDPQRLGVRRLLPTSLSHTPPVVLITSRQLYWPDLQPMPLPLWTPQESSEFVFHQLKLDENEANRKDAETLSEVFGGLPLAVQAAAAVIHQHSKGNKLMGKDIYTIKHLLSDYSQGKREVLQKSPPGSPDCLPLMLLWKVSLDKLRQQPHGNLVTQILNVMAHLSPTNTPKELLFFIFNSEDSDSLVDAVVLLVDYSFVHDFHKHFSIHRMLQDVTLAHLEVHKDENPEEEELLLTTSPLKRITTAFKKYWPMVAKSSEAYYAVHDNLVHVTKNHVLPKVESPLEKDLHFVEFIEFVFEEIKNTRPVEAEKFCRVLISYFTTAALPSHSVKIDASIFTSPNLIKVHSLRLQLARILKDTQRYKEAVDICQQCLSSFNSLEDQEDFVEEILDTKYHLASILNSQGEYEEAIKLFSSVLDRRSKLHGPTHKLTLDTKNNLALTMQNSHRLSEAKALYAEILEVRMKELGPLHPDTLTTKHNMAMILNDEGRCDDALEMLREVVEVEEKELGPLHATTLRSNHNMAVVLEKQGKAEDALRIYESVICRYEKASAASHSDCLNAKHRMALILLKQGRVDEAKEMLCQVLNIQERLLGPSHKYTLTTKHNVAWVLEEQGNHAEALKLYEEVLELKTKQLGPMHPAHFEPRTPSAGFT